MGISALLTAATKPAATSVAGAHHQRRDGSRPSGKKAMAQKPTTETAQVQDCSQAAQGAAASGPAGLR